MEVEVGSLDRFELYEWDEYGQNALTLLLRDMAHGQRPIDREAIFVAAHDLEFCHMRINNWRRRSLWYKYQTFKMKIKGEK